MLTASFKISLGTSKVNINGNDGRNHDVLL